MEYHFGLFTLIFLLKQFNDISTHNSSESVDLRNISVNELDMLITESILHPQKGKGEELMKNTFTYYDILDDVKNLMDEGHPMGQRIVDEIGIEGPKWVKVKFNESILRRMFNWVSRDMSHFVATIDTTVELWDSLNDDGRTCDPI
uniref:Uncharacterized protein n=1 Tax=Graphocephala atropunctata TaxID=36148 RepID=A0A1B6KR54_9HEMI